MIQHGDTLLSEFIFEKKFVCDLTKCKGACCIEGDAGAPLQEEELVVLEEIIEEVKPYMRQEGLKAIEKNGLFEVDQDGEYVTTLVDGRECAYVFFNEKGMATCAIEKAYEEGKIDFKKPISCHLYPIRVMKLHDLEALNYSHWDICNPACKLGEELQVKTYQFLKEPLIRKYGEEWYNHLEIIDQELDKLKR